MTTYYKYRIRCTTDNVYEYWILDSTASVPTTCPTNTAHTVDTTQTTIVDTIEKNKVTIREETFPTGGNFGVHSVKLNAIKNTTTVHESCWPYPISALFIDFLTEEIHRGDVLSATIGEDTITGIITANVAPVSAWTTQNYVVGDMVTYTDPVHGLRTYTCMVNTVSNEIPTNTTYWRHGLEISVSQTVIDNTEKGYYIKLYDGTNTNDVDRVTHIDSENNKIYVETNLTNSFLAATPTYIKQTVYLFKNYYLETPWNHDIGQSKIGGSHIPTDVVVRCHYTNNSTDTDKVFIGRVEYLY